MSNSNFCPQCGNDLRKDKKKKNSEWKILLIGMLFGGALLMAGWILGTCSTRTCGI